MSLGRVLAVALVGIALFGALRGCGFTPDPGKGPGEACTRTSECRSGLECRGGVCASPSEDAGADAGTDGG
ncbi:MAG: hypothetical protein IT378_21360 [Sandaracinaceae bacterium]|nr:hypothetical protein [Sandaracinaceae bacterium]MCC6876867.1 hypothetical protein [Sandaracinaceae bacterium]